ncbi:MAG: protein kinase [Verrucomicrobiaceae bacterium]|nr:protein kinase [Verrucomicrobiaceae bacterium]
MTIHPPEQTFLSTCPVCQEQIDVTSLEPFTKLKCPFCGQMVRVRRRFDHFMIIRQIGEGGMSRVFEAEDETLGRRVALKILNRTYSRDAVRMEQFRQEALITASITHPNVIKLYSVGYDQGYFYLAMELVGGGSLEQRIRREGKLKEGEALRIGHEVAEGLRAAQHQGLIHRDVKPANILFTETGTAKVVDFGLALFTERGPDRSAEIWATPYYVAPEKILHNQEDYRSDIFSLGATLFHALTGGPPHQVDSHAIEELRRIKSRRVSLGDSGLRFAARTEHVVNHILSFKPEDRFANYEEVVEELRLADGLLNQAGIRRRLFSRRARLIGSVAAAIMLAFFFGWLLGEGKQLSTSKKIARQLGTVESGALDGGGVTVTAGSKTTAEIFLEARQDMLETKGQPASARDKFDRLADSNDTRQPTRCWARFNAALCAIMMSNRGSEKDRQRVIEEFRDLARLAAKPDMVAASADLGRFFTTLAGRMEKSPGLGLALDKLGYNTHSEEVLGYLVHGLAEWHFGHDSLAAAEAMEHFERRLVDLKSTADWVPSYVAIVQRYKQDFAPVRTALKQHKAGTLDEVRTALDAVRGALDALEKSGAKKLRSGPYLGQVESMEAGLKREIARIRFEEQKTTRPRDETRRQADLAQLAELNQLIPALVHGYDYSRVIALLADSQFDTPDVRTALDGRQTLYTSAREFIRTLQQDLAAKGWSGQIHRREGGSLTGAVSFSSTDPAHLQVKVDGGTVSIDLDSVSPQSLVEIAQSFTAQVTDSTEYYHRQGLAAFFARASGLVQFSDTLAAQLMEENRPFRARWTKITEAGI